MNQKLKRIIRTVRLELAKEPEAIVIGKLGNGLSDENINETLKDCSYYEFLKECNGARCGAIDLWSYKILLENQYRVTEILGGTDIWICIGQILYEPIVINKAEKKVYRFYQGHEVDVPPDCFGDLDTFLEIYVFGHKYVEIVPDAVEDEWYQLLQRVKLV